MTSNNVTDGAVVSCTMFGALIINDTVKVGLVKRVGPGTGHPQ
jgi:hypothetical protein